MQGHAADLFTRFLTRYVLTLVHGGCMLLVLGSYTVRPAIAITALIRVMRLQPLQMECDVQAV